MRHKVLFRMIAIGLVAGGTTTATVAEAAGWRASHPRRAEVNARLENQHDRIQAGIKDDQLSRGEVHRLRREDRTIRHEERAMARFDGGHLTRADQRALNSQENRVSRQIHRDRHN